MQRNDQKHFVHVKEETQSERSFYKCGSFSFQSLSGRVLLSKIVHQIAFVGFSGLATGDRRDSCMEIPFSASIDSGQSNMFMTPPPAHQNIPHGVQGLNPIDRLYSMQSSYFCGEDESMSEQ